MDNEINVTAVILNHNDNRNAVQLVGSLLSSGVVSHIAVVDNSEKDGLCGKEKQLLDPRVFFIRSGNNGYASGNDLGIKAADNKFGPAEYYIVSNPDVEVGNEAIEACLDFLENHHDYAISTPRLVADGDSVHPLSGWKERTLTCDLAYSSGILSRLIGMYREKYPDDYWNGPYSTVDCVTGAFFIVRGDVFREIGLFDKRTFLFYEEDIIGIKLKQRGLKAAVINTCSFVHREGVSRGKNRRYVRKYLIMQKSRLYFHKAYKKQNAGGMLLLYMATALGLIESIIKTIIRK